MIVTDFIGLDIGLDCSLEPKRYLFWNILKLFECSDTNTS